MLVGNSACGKSTLVKLVKHTFENYVGHFQMENMVKKKNTNPDLARDNGWICGVYDTRICFSSELKLTTEKNKIVKFDGNLMKIVSGNDPIECRSVYERDMKIIVKSLCVGVMNDIMEIDPVDESVLRRMNNFFADRCSKKGITEPNELYFPATDTDEFGKYLNDPLTWNKFIQLMCIYYKKPIEKPECVESDTIESSGANELNDESWITENYIKDSDGFILFKTVYDRFNESHTMSKKKFTTWLKSKGLLTGQKTINRKTECYILGIKNSNESDF